MFLILMFACALFQEKREQDRDWRARSEAMQKTTSKAPRMKMKRMNDARQIRRAVWKYARHEIVRLIRFTVLGICYFLLIALLLIDRISQLGLL